MSCDNDNRRLTMSLALGELSGDEAAGAARHAGTCPGCAALLKAVGAQRAALAAAPLTPAGAGFASAVRERCAGGSRPVLAAGLVAAAACCAALLLFWPQRRPDPSGPPAAASLTPGFTDPYGVIFPGGAAGSDFLGELSLRARADEPSGEGTVISLKEGV